MAYSTFSKRRCSMRILLESLRIVSFIPDKYNAMMLVVWPCFFQSKVFFVDNIALRNFYQLQFLSTFFFIFSWLSVCGVSRKYRSFFARRPIGVGNVRVDHLTNEYVSFHITRWDVSWNLMYATPPNPFSSNIDVTRITKQEKRKLNLKYLL